jgi:hypothetical protein
LLPHYEAKSTPTSLSKPFATHETKRDGKSVVTKRKQLSLDALLPKKTIKTSHQQVATSANITVQGNTQANNPKDTFNFVNKSSSLSDAEKYEILTNTWKPESTYSFPPENSSGRRSQYGWLTCFPWLAYSAAANGGFCINCVLFGNESTHNTSKLQLLMTLPFIRSTSSINKLTQHAHK